MRVLAPLAGAAVLACGALAGCASADAARTSPAGGSALCADIGHIDGLAISRINALPQNHETFTFPARIKITGVRQARSVARTLCELPAMPSGAFSCPGDWGITYRLTFSASDRRLPPVTVDASGCQSVDGLSPGRWTARSPGFWTVLAIVAHITPVNEATFIGSRPS
jgi:hypothetical protein